MGIDIIPATYCADYWAEFEVAGSKGAKYTVIVDGEGMVTCTCPAYKFVKGERKTCKHINTVFQKGCFWNPQYYDGGTREMRPTRHTREDFVDGEQCPTCGGPTVGVRIAV